MEIIFKRQRGDTLERGGTATQDGSVIICDRMKLPIRETPDASQSQKLRLAQPLVYSDCHTCFVMGGNGRRAKESTSTVPSLEKGCAPTTSRLRVLQLPPVETGSRNEPRGMHRHWFCGRNPGLGTRIMRITFMTSEFRAS